MVLLLVYDVVNQDTSKQGESEGQLCSAQIAAACEAYGSDNNAYPNVSTFEVPKIIKKKLLPRISTKKSFYQTASFWCILKEYSRGLIIC
jgi:hypothetical protein